ncbi:hypothetical protein LOZ12_000522 [Ophidiomyces ophidiicola]|uniref:Uncharacterized protein n=1 Tax=Ophidiomyces ophidiicola TaxID=1387563 RepID=A0ACB8V4W9_9EURO|nr:uncharacterized protein LOZ57_003418 [Ophidiomyces ophidiicola]KAI1926051.1 hypothetical protein LOZ64_000368 [Ophidiomyces ophidiicola]KAI1947180.1 hypothetical protein LOZ57_003418 [Ophidiomyces ophidiicola]KAI1955696.1 hypothetical protein LOZ62_000247 [Ophidiomyces ophidiicola]KAI1975992.1 hypothetical protein LOZ56_000309 [Ophidiomyces ophidiicola]KAI2011361.1 hypothetical protein LOZ50_000721 [Ophidiomyces ophidiicola]
MRRYIITPVEDKDWTSLVEIQFRAFSTECFFHLLYGEDTHLNRSRCKERYLGQLRKQTNILWLKATDAHDPERKLLGAAKYDLNPAYTAGIPLKFNPDSMFWLDDVEEKKAAAATWELVTDRRAKHIKAPHIQLDLIFVAPEYQGKAIGNGLLDWGIELASHMMLPLEVYGNVGELGYSIYHNAEKAKIDARWHPDV